MSKRPIIKVQGVQKTFGAEKGKIDVLKGIDFEINNGEFVIIFGPSGCGKSTLLNTVVGLERPTKGTVTVRGQKIYDLKPDQRAKVRRQKFGIIYQQSNWVKSLSVLENVAFPLNIIGVAEGKALKRARSLLTLFRLEEYEKNMPTELSGGQQQRVSVTRALITNPWIVVADEPTGNLDTVSAADLMYVLQYLNSELKRTIIMVTHNPDYEKYASKVITMEDGKIKEIKVKHKVDVDEHEATREIVPEEEGVPSA